MNPYLTFKGDCEQALNLYARCLGGQVGRLYRYAGTPFEKDAPSDWADKIMHGSLTVGDQTLMAADVVPGRYEEPKGFSMSLHTKSGADADRIFHELATGGRVVMPLEETFWAARFAVVVDRFGIQWVINCDAEQPPPG